MNKLLPLLLLVPFLSFGQLADSVHLDAPKKHWYETIAIRGYMQIRYNRLAETNPKLKCEQCDKSWGDNNNFFIRRMRIIFFGQISERVYIYIQPDFGNAASATGLHFGQLRDAYMDLSLDKKNEFRIRIGQSKIPFGFENMQSSQNRIPLDRNDAINSAAPNERDLGAFFYWAPDKIRKRFTHLVNDNLKGSGDYGVVGIGVHNGQGANKPELNNQMHVVGRITYPFQIGNQIIEPSIQAYTGQYVMASDQLSTGIKTTKDKSYLDQRAAATFVLYPQPFGIQAESNIGKGPEFNYADSSIKTKDLTGGYVTLSYALKYKKQAFFPFVRMQYYNGGKKLELDARSYTVNEYEAGIEWQPVKNFELVTMFTSSKRRFEDLKTPKNTQQGSLIRIQAQLNF